MEGKRKKDDNTKNTLFTYFSKKSRNNKLNKESCDDDNLNQTIPETHNIVLSVDQPSCSTLKQDETIDNELETHFRSNDIGLFTNCTLTDADKKLVLKNVWVPDVNYEFPLLEKYKAKGLKFQYKWFTEFNWLVYSEIKQGDRKNYINRSRLIPIIECVILCGQQEIALRGHRDSGKINKFENQGNFRSILKFRSRGDAFLNSIIEEEREIVGKVNASEGFAVLADETTDIATKEQLTLCVRFIDNNNMVNESFLQFVIINSLTGNDLASAIIDGLNNCGINCDYLIGQGYDGASNMSGKYKGVQAIVREKYPKAIYVHCAAHTLNLAVSKASNIQPIRNCLRLCATRWIQRYDAVNDFAELFPYVMDALDNISISHDSLGTDASILSKSIDSEFIISLQVVKLLFSYGLPLCKQLQKIRIDLKEAVELSNDVIKHLKLIRTNAKEEFHKLFLQAEVSAIFKN
ncbi:52 kDa repressor of the inhibitor of the protein kinase-like [Aphis craccivora]|uniref:52 kDa repressor of the inhibitor of the protein kinase-like n=1 Tax=Aphis craccivora TaxID=307492 RepID=A0A6G0VVU3_APHCR|nr:52 kDa repressor of the inhibitor of the protein kinase-like [Aphis craccivora]